MTGGTGLRTTSHWPTETADHKSRQERLWYVDRTAIERTKPQLLSPAEREALLSQVGSIIEPLLDAKLEAKALELLERYGDRWLGTLSTILGDGEFPREELLCTREAAAKMLGVSLSTIKRMEAAGELPEPIKLGERRVAHRIVDIEKLAKFKGKPRVSGPE